MIKWEAAVENPQKNNKKAGISIPHSKHLTQNNFSCYNVPKSLIQHLAEGTISTRGNIFLNFGKKLDTFR